MNSFEFNHWLAQLHQSISDLSPSLRPLIMGILNLTPDSFSDGGQYNSLDKALEHAYRLIDAGADIIDIGGESTRPGSDSVSDEEELERVIPLIRALRANSDICISIDTSKARVMEAAIAAGANIINDVNALQSLGAVEVASQLGVPVCLMHMRGIPKSMQNEPEYPQGIIRDIQEFFAQRIEACNNAGITSKQLILDPGFGFGKTVQNNLELLNQLKLFKDFGQPLLLGVSRKSTIGSILNKDVDERLIGGLTLAVFAVLQGVNIIRTHDVDETRQAFTVVNAVLNANRANTVTN